MASPIIIFKTITPSSRAGKAIQRLLSRLYGHFHGYLKKNFKSGIKQKEYDNIPTLKYSNL